jgi:hypothetical protein
MNEKDQKPTPRFQDRRNFLAVGAAGIAAAGAGLQTASAQESTAEQSHTNSTCGRFG